ncbi:response regulator [Winogradskyella sp.]|uniref:response regulator n=1 Tax=Winogradskyella sp. TaxID=1883156 RepID=UPI00260F409B|nr:response regulator [uncultured Winogradskyella sp.]
MNKTAIIDDNMVFRKVTQILLKNIGIREENILLFENGKEMFDFMESNSNSINVLPQMIFLDLNMPVMDGWDFLTQLQGYKKKTSYNPKIYILTSSVDQKDYQNVVNITTVEKYLIKPINEETITKIYKEYYPEIL